MNLESVHILLVDDVPLDAIEIGQQLEETMDIPFMLTNATSLDDALTMLQRNDPRIDIVVLYVGLSGPYAPRMVFGKFEPYVREFPIMVMTSKEDHDLALTFMGAGASDTLCRDDLWLNNRKLKDAIEFSLARGKLLKDASSTSRESEQMASHLMAYISGGYSFSDNDSPLRNTNSNVPTSNPKGKSHA